MLQHINVVFFLFISFFSICRTGNHGFLYVSAVIFYGPKKTYLLLNRIEIDLFQPKQNINYGSK